jgi:hypothetical protein
MLQSNQVLSFFRACERGDWSQPELAEFYRVEDALTKTGVGISADRGLTDEGEPWFVFYRQDNEEVIVHFARIGGEYVVASNFTEAVFRGRNFQTLVRELLDSHPYVLPKQHSSRSTVFLHPATLLAALVVTCYVKSSELNATADDGSRPEKSLGWFLNRHDLAATYSAIVIAAVWDSLAVDSSVSKPFDDLVSLDHAQPAHGEHGTGLAVADDSLPQNFQVSHGANDRSVSTATALDLDGQDAVHDVNEPAIAGLVANPSGLHPESSHHDNAAAFSAYDVFRAENYLDSKLADFRLQHYLADFRLQHDGGFPIAAREQGERTDPVSSSALSNLNPDHPTSQHVSTAPTTAIEYSDTTIAPDNHSSALHVEDTVNPLILNVTSLSDVIQAPVSDLQPDNPLIPNVTSLSDVMQAPVSDLQPEVTSIGEPTALVNQVTSMSEPAAQVNQITSISEPAAQVNQVTSTSEPAAQVNQVTSTSEPTAQVNQVTSTSEPAAQVSQATSTSEPAAQVSQVTSTSEPAAQVSQVTSTSEPAAQVNQVTSTSEPTAQVNQATSISEPAALGLEHAHYHAPRQEHRDGEQVNYAALPGGVTPAQHDVEAGMSDGSTLSIVGIDVHHAATVLA